MNTLQDISGSQSLGSSDIDHLRWVVDLNPDLIRRRAVLDLGCARGTFCSAVAKHGSSFVVCLDVVPVASDAPRQGWQFVAADLDSDSWRNLVPQPPEGRFDLISAFDLIEHLQSPVRFLRQCRELLAEDGHLIVTTPNTGSWERFVRGPRWSGARDAQHRILFSRYSLRFLMEREGFDIVSLRAPVRSLETRHIPHPPIGAQIFCAARRLH